LQLQPQLFVKGPSCHEGAKHDCSAQVSENVTLATLNSNNRRGWLYERQPPAFTWPSWKISKFLVRVGNGLSRSLRSIEGGAKTEKLQASLI